MKRRLCVPYAGRTVPTVRTVLVPTVFSMIITVALSTGITQVVELDFVWVRISAGA